MKGFKPLKKSQGLFFIIFTASGFAGLIYESIWTHYLKLFLGHAAYAQTLVLAIFMSGMALGAWLCSQWAGRWKNLLRVYAITEALIGIGALVFHSLFVRFLEFSYSVVIPSLGSPATISLLKWGFSGLLILPQSILLGMTFPLMTAGLIRRFSISPGATISMLYFTNSIGAAVGVLASGFWFISWVGLPGTIMIAGFINLILALVVWRLSDNEASTSAKKLAQSINERSIPNRDREPGYHLFLLIALITGLASFIYEIGWIRMLNLVLGSSTHAFELMLSAFITGLALGGFWIRRRIDQYSHPVRILAFVQLAMGGLALGTLPIYNYSFGIMQWLMHNLNNSDAGYRIFNLSSHGIALLIMLPTTFCAGMTVPLITYLLMRQGHGEKSIGAVYAANTVGGIIGVIFAVHIGLPILGLKGAISLGAGLDIALGLLLVWRVFPSVQIPILVTVIGAGSIFLTVLIVELDPIRMASGVYRFGRLFSSDQIEIVYQQDGKTATVNVLRDLSGALTISTNGKPDARLNLTDNNIVLPDEYTMILAGALPVLLNPSAEDAAIIGIGSGLTTHTMLSQSTLKRVDTIEIEPAMVRGATWFEPRVARVFEDSRSRIHIEDAKSFFSNHNKKYDIIVSEPSNPWVSGVSGLFSIEFYQLIKKYLKAEGLLVQWLQLYEIDMPLVASVIKAVSSQFDDYVIYGANIGDILIVASPYGKVAEPEWGMEFLRKGVIDELRRINIQTPNDLHLRKLGNKEILDPFFNAFSIASNSDYYPILDLNATRTRFLHLNAAELITLGSSPIPVLDLLNDAPSSRAGSRVSFDPHFHTAIQSNLSSMLYDYLLGGPWEWAHEEIDLPDNIRVYADAAREALNNCPTNVSLEAWVSALHNNVAKRIIPYASPGELAILWERLESQECWPHLLPAHKDFIALYKSVGARDGRLMAAASRKILSNPVYRNPLIVEYALASGMAGEITSGNPSGARQLWNNYSDRLDHKNRLPFYIRLLLVHSFKGNLKAVENYFSDY